MEDVNKNRWDQAVGSLYKTVDGHTVLITAYTIRLSEPGSRIICEDVHGALMEEELVDGKPKPLPPDKWKRLLFDPNGAHKGGDVFGTATLDIVQAIRGAAR